MKGTDLLSHLEFLGREFLAERRIGWAFTRHRERNDVDVLKVVYVGPERSGMTLQAAVELVAYAITQRSTMDEELETLDGYSSDMTNDGDFVFRRLTRN